MDLAGELLVDRRREGCSRTQELYHQLDFDA
jgi:hypothetical protein